MASRLCIGRGFLWDVGLGRFPRPGVDDFALLGRRMRNYSSEQMLAELWLVRVLRERKIQNPNLGVTDLSTRKENFRHVLISNNLEQEIAGWKGGNPQRFGEVFAKIYNEPLVAEGVNENG